jgi:hypothetical protein
MIFRLENILISSIRFAESPSLEQVLGKSNPWSCRGASQTRALFIFHPKFRGLIAYREIRDAGFDVHIYERDSVPGGNWHYSDEVPVHTSIPNDRNVAVGDYTPSLPPKGASFPYVEEYNNVEENDFLRRAHRAPKPIWKSLTSNVPTVR